jgi:flagellar capping protein FliD
MGELRFPGLATGIDTAALIKQIMIINSRRLAKYQVQKTEYDTQNTALDGLRAKISALQSAASALSDADNLDIFNTSTRDSNILTVGASSDANPGSHSIEVDQLATTETWIQDTSTFDYKTDYVLTDDSDGVFIYSYNNVERTITAVKNVTTLEDMVNLINNDEDNPGVTASLLHQGGKYHLMLSGQQSGEDYKISVNVSNTEVWKASSALTNDSVNVGLTTKITELDTFGGTLGAGDDAYITISGTRTDGTTFTTNLDVTANTTVGHIIDEINSRFEVDGARAATATLVNGKIRLTDHTCGASTLVLNTLTYDNGSGSTTLTDITFDESVKGGAIPESLSSLASTSFTETQNAQNSQIKINDFTPAAVAEVQTLSTDAPPTSGHYHLSYGGETTGEILYNASFADIKTALELLSTIDTITVGGSGTSLANGNVTFTFANALGNVGLISVDSSGLDTNGTIVETTKGNNSEWVSRNGNSITDALTGITLNLHDVTEAETPIKITISRNTGSVSKKIQTMVTAYNALIAELKTKTEYDAEAKKMGILSKDIAISFIKTQTRDPFIGIADGFIDTIDDFVQASDIGLSIDGAGMMEFDTDEFNNALNDNFDAVLELLGATKSGNSSDTMIQFYGASDKYTTAGTYDIEVDIASNAITGVRIKLSSESTWRTAPWPGNFVTGNSDFDDNGDPLYPENGLQFTVDPNQSDGTYTATINVKQGIAGALEDLLEGVVEVDGRLDTSKGILDDRIIAMDRRIKNEENRLTSVETRLINKYARLEKTLAMMQQQMGAISMVNTATFGS